MWQLHNFDADDFLASFWQQKPLLIRQALPGFETLLEPEELAGLACEESVHSRLVIEKDAESPWHLRYGPFSEQDFTSLPPTHYSLLVSECEKWIPELQDLVDCFDFLPKWRIDDLMISYAPDQGSVGPHIDEYDVFLIQANGKRRWSLESQARQNPELIPDLDLAIMQEFSPDKEWELEPGDILYLPPKIAHHGVAVGDGCMTYSVGFRAPALADIMDSLMLEASDHKMTDRRYTDPALDANRNPSEINITDINRFQSMVTEMLKDSAEMWPDIVGKLVSDSTLSDHVETCEYDSVGQAAADLWQKHPDTRLFYFANKPQLKLYCNGQDYPLHFSDNNLALCKILCNQSVIDIQVIAGLLSNQTETTLLSLINSHALIPQLDDDD